MKRTYIYLIVALLSITIASADFIIGKDLQKIVPIDEQFRAIEETIPEETIEEAKVVTSIKIKNEQNSDEVITYKYSIKSPELAGAYRYVINDQEGYMVFTANGESSFELKSNESITIYDIPVDSDYTITQETVNDKYTTKVGDKESKTYTAKTTSDNNITFNNSTKKEDVKKPTEEPKKEDKKAKKKEIPNTGETEIKMILVLLTSFLVIYCFRKIKIKRFE